MPDPENDQNSGPKLENGFARVSNELLEAIFRANFSAAQLRVVLWVVRDSYGWGGRRWSRNVSMETIAREISMPSSSARWAVTGLLAARVILRDDQNRYGLNSHPDQWLFDPCPANPLAENANPLADGTANPLARIANPLAKNANPLALHIRCSKKKERKERDGAHQNHRFRPPTIEEVQAYCSERGNSVNVERWHAHYTAVGWKVGRKGVMSDWRAAVRTWEPDGFKPKGKSTAQASAPAEEEDELAIETARILRENPDFA